MKNMEVMQMKAYSLYCSAKDTAASVFEKKSIIFMLMAVVCVCNIMPVFADGLFDELTAQLTSAYNSFIPIVNICALIFGGAAGIVFMMSSDEKTAGSAKRWLIRIAVGWLIVSVFPFILIKSREMLGDTATGTGADELKNIKPGTS